MKKAARLLAAILLLMHPAAAACSRAAFFMGQTPLFLRLCYVYAGAGRQNAVGRKNGRARALP